MDLPSDTGSIRRNSFTSQQNIAHDIISDIYVTSDAPDEFSTFTTDNSLIKGVGLGATSTAPTIATTSSTKACNKRSYSVDTIKFQYPQMQQSATTSCSTTFSQQQQQQQLPPSLAAIAARKQRQRSQSAQYLNTTLVKPSPTTASLSATNSSSSPDSQKHFKSEENLKEDVNEDEFIDSLIAEYGYSQDDFNNNNNSSNNLNDGDDEAEEEDDEEQEIMEDDGNLTQVSSFDDDCYIFDVHDTMRKE